MRHYKYTIEIDLSEFSDWDLFNFNKGYTLGEAIFESIITWETPVYYDTDYFLDEYRDSAIDYLLKQGFTKKEISQFNDEFESDILRACSDSWRSSVECGIYDLYEDKTENPGFEFSDFQYIDNKGNSTKYLNEAVSVQYGFSEKLWRELIYDATELRFRDTLAYTRETADDDLYEYAIDNLDKLITGNHGDFDQVESYSDIDKNFIDLFADYNEVIPAILENRKNKQTRIKGMIQNHVNLEKRQSFINSMEYRP